MIQKKILLTIKPKTLAKFIYNKKEISSSNKNLGKSMMRTKMTTKNNITVKNR